MLQTKTLYRSYADYNSKASIRASEKIGENGAFTEITICVGNPNVVPEKWCNAAVIKVWGHIIDDMAQDMHSNMSMQEARHYIRQMQKSQNCEITKGNLLAKS